MSFLATTNKVFVAMVTLSGIVAATTAFAPGQSSVLLVGRLQAHNRLLTVNNGGARQALEMPGFTCVDNVCTGNTKSCTADGSCAYTEVTQVTDAQGNIATIKTCNRWGPDPTGSRRDGCITDTMDGFDFVSCVAEFENDSGEMVTCNTCTRCEDDLSVSMDCTNVVPGKEPYTCELLDLTDGGDVSFAAVPAQPPTGTSPTPSAPAPASPETSDTAESQTPSTQDPDSSSVRHYMSVFTAGFVALFSCALITA